MSESTSSSTSSDSDIDDDMKLTRDDYVKILDYYGERRGKNTAKNTQKKPAGSLTDDSLQKRALGILGTKFCRCIRPGPKTGSRKNKRSTNIKYDPLKITYCTKSIFNKRGLKRHGFRCRNHTNKLVQGVTKTKKQLVFGAHIP